MAYLYLVAFKGQPYGREDDFNYALRELLGEHCSYCIPAGRTEVFGPSTPGHHLAEICWLLQEVGYTSRSYWELIDQLRDQYEKINGCKPQLGMRCSTHEMLLEKRMKRVTQVKAVEIESKLDLPSFDFQLIKPPKR